MQEPIPAALPEQVLKSKRAIDLYMVAVLGMVAIGLIAVVGAIILAVFGKEIPVAMWGVVATAVGSIATMLGGRGASGND